MKSVCGKFMPRADTKCRLLEGHRGNCRSRVWYCDSCGKPHGGQPASTAHDSDGVPCAEFCFMCCLAYPRDYVPAGRKEITKAH